MKVMASFKNMSWKICEKAIFIHQQWEMSLCEGFQRKWRQKSHHLSSAPKTEY